MEAEFDLIDDSGLLGLVDSSSYKTFVDGSWQYAELMDHFSAQMQRGTILVWDCADGGDDYRVRVRDRITGEAGFREQTGLIVATSNQLHVASYTSLTMAAQFQEYRIPGKHEEALVVPVRAGTYRVRVVQMYDPKMAAAPTSGVHILVELELGTAPRWNEVAWRVA